MMLKWFVLCLWAMPAMLNSTGGSRKCPTECTCNVDEFDRYEAVCTKGGLTSFPVNQLDTDVRVVIIKGPRNALTMGPLFLRFPKLEVLRITDSNIPAIGAGYFWGLQYLRILDLSKNNITNITENNFRGQDNLHELDLSKNKILSMASSTFRHLRELRRLNLADNSIVELVQRNFYMLNNLKYLDLSGNPLQDLIPDIFRDLPELRIFKCRNCQLKKINPQLYNLLPQLIELDLGRNEFKFLDKDEFRDVKRLTKLLLDGNQLSVVVDELFRMQKNLNHLDLSYNRLAKVPNDSFQFLGNLTFLDLSYNKLVRLEVQSVRNLKQLQVLNISGNTQMNLNEMQDTFEIIPHLTHLAIADMGALPMGLLVPFKQLRYLNISGNHLDNISLQVIDPCRELQFLDLSRNQLYGINEATALRIQGIRNVRLDNNPLICDECHMGKLINVVRHLQWKWETYPICFLPKSLRGAEITDLDEGGLDACLEYITDEEQNAASTSHNFLERDLIGNLNMLAVLGGIIFALIAVLLLAMVVCFSKQRARYYTREDRLNSGEAKCLEKNAEAKVIITPSETGSKVNNGNSSTTASDNPSGHTNANTSSARDNGASPNEINFKFPITDADYTIDEHVLPPAATAPAAAARELQAPSPGSIMYSSLSPAHGTATAMAAVAAAVTVIPPGVPSATASMQQRPNSVQLGAATAMTQMRHSTASLPPEAVVLVLPSTPLPSITAAAAAANSQMLHEDQLQLQQQQQQQQRHQQLLHLSTLEPLVSVN